MFTRQHFLAVALTLLSFLVTIIPAWALMALWRDHITEPEDAGACDVSEEDTHYDYVDLATLKPLQV